MGLIPALLTSLSLLVSGFGVRGFLVEDAYRRSAAIEQAIDDFGFPITESLWKDVNDVGAAIIAMILTVFTFFVDLILMVMYLMFQLALKSPMLLIYTAGWVTLTFALVSIPSALVIWRKPR
jgi:hypothetical protein